MAKTTEMIVTLTDDIDGSRANRTVSSSFDGSNYEIELSKKSAAAFEKALQPYIGAARKVRGGTTRKRSVSPTGRAGSRTNLAAVREWAKSNGIAVSDRGRIAKTVQEAYDAAH